MDRLPFYCDICYFHLGSFDPKDVKLPITGRMFKARNDLGQYPPPFLADLSWLDLRCRQCGKRPFRFEDKIRIAHGEEYYDLNGAGAGADDPVGDGLQGRLGIKQKQQDSSTGPSKFTCKLCGKEYAHQQSLGRHLRKVHRGTSDGKQTNTAKGIKGRADKGAAAA